MDENILIAMCGIVLLGFNLVCIGRQYYAACVMLPYLANGISYGFTSVAGMSFIWLATFIAILNIIVICLVLFRKNKKLIFNLFAFDSVLKALLLCSVIALCRVGIGIANIYDDAVDPMTDAMVCVRDVVLPMLTLSLAGAVLGPMRAIRQFMTGSYCLCLIWLGFGVVVELSQGRFFSASIGDERLTLFGIDSISSSRCLPIFILASFYLESTFRKGLSRSLLLGSGLLGAYIGILIATRQHLLAGLFCFAFTVWLVGRRFWKWFLPMGVIVAVLILVFQDFSTFILSERLAKETITTDGRFDIWKKALNLAAEHPLTGVGFGNFGEIEAIYNSETGKVLLVKDYAHGIVFDLLAEHGILVGGFWIFAYIAGLSLAICEASKASTPEFKFAWIALVTLPVSLLFSGTIWNGTYFWIGLCLAILASYQAGLDRMKSPATTFKLANANSGSSLGDGVTALMYDTEQRRS